MVFRCFTTVFPLKLRNMSYHPFIYILSLLAVLQGTICILPYFHLEIIVKRYEYSPNFGECLYGIDGNQAPGMLALIDVLWWGPFFICILSCVVFFIFMKLHAKKISGARRRSDKGSDIKKKTALLTAFFIFCYFPKALFSLFDFLLSTDRFITWTWLNKVMGGQDKAVILYVYLNLMCKWFFPAGRAAFTPIMLRLQTYLRRCDTSKRIRVATRGSQSTLPSMATRMSFIRSISKIFRTDTQTLIKQSPGNGVKVEPKKTRSVPV
jgi:hypothetical protein